MGLHPHTASYSHVFVHQTPHSLPSLFSLLTSYSSSIFIHSFSVTALSNTLRTVVVFPQEYSHEQNSQSLHQRAPSTEGETTEMVWLRWGLELDAVGTQSMHS